MPIDLRAPPEQALPAVLQLPRHRSVFRFGEDGRLLGLDPEVALAVDRLTPALAAMLDELAQPTPAVALLARAVQRGAPFEVAERLLHELVRAGALVDAVAIQRRDRQRAENTVVVSGDGPLAVGVVLGLVQAGVGAVHTEAAGPVLADDMGTGHIDADRGRERAAAIRAAVRRVRPDADAPPPPARVNPDLVVLADALAPDLVRLTRWQDRGSPLLPIRMRDGIGLVGPLVVPGRTACLSCIELQRTELAADWPSVAAQLTGRCGQADPAAVAATAALGVAQVLVALESTSSGGVRPPTWETTLELDAAAGVVARRGWSPQDGCGCAVTRGHVGASGGLRHDGATSADPAGGERIMG